MKFSLILFLHFQSIFLPLNLNGQSWEVFFEDSILSQSYYLFACPAPNNGVRVIPDKSIITPIFSFDEEGNYIGQNTLDWATDWRLTNADHTGASYWRRHYNMRKVTANDEIIWTYSPAFAAGLFQAKAAPNGSTCLQYSDSNSNYAIDYVDANGQLVKHFTFSTGWPDVLHYLPGHDSSLIYTNDLWGTNPTHWIKLNYNEQVVWELDLNDNEQLLAGSLSDGSTYYFDDNEDILTKLSAVGTVEWERNMTDYNTTNTGFRYPGMLVRQNGSIILCIENYDIITGKGGPLFISLNPSNGLPIWTKHAATTFNICPPLRGPLAEMPDGGILACLGYVNDQVLIIRTDKNGNTLSSQIVGNAIVPQAKIRPVPAHDKVEILLPSDAVAVVSWKLVDMNGQVLRIGGEEPANFLIHRNGLPSGFYWCQLVLENGSTAIGRIIFD